MPNTSSTPVTETKIIMSDPTALGVGGLSMVTLVAASQKMGWTSGSYCAGAVFLNSYFGRTLLPIGKPFGFIRKGPPAQPAKVVHVIEPAAAASTR